MAFSSSEGDNRGDDPSLRQIATFMERRFAVSMSAQLQRLNRTAARYDTVDQGILDSAAT